MDWALNATVTRIANNIVCKLYSIGRYYTISMNSQRHITISFRELDIDVLAVGISTPLPPNVA